MLKTILVQLKCLRNHVSAEFSVALGSGFAGMGGDTRDEEKHHSLPPDVGAKYLPQQSVLRLCLCDTLSVLSR